MTEMKEGTYDTIGHTKPVEDSQVILLQMVKYRWLSFLLDRNL